MSLATPDSTPVVNKNQQIVPRKDWTRYNVAKRALIETGLPFEVIGFFMFVESLQGTKDHAFPTFRAIAKQAGSNDKASRIIKMTEQLLPEVFEVERTAKGRRRNSYKVTPFDKWPDNVIARLLNAPKIGTQGVVVHRKSEHYMALRENGTNILDITRDSREIPMDITGQKLRRSTGPDDIATCCRCKKETADWVRVESGDYFCGMECIEKYQPRQWKVKQ